MENSQPSFYAVIPSNVRYDRDLTPNAKLLYGEITALTNMNGYCWASNKYFADLYGVSTTSISKWISQLTKKGYLALIINYKEGSKEIESRHIRLPFQMPPIEEKLNTPIEEKLKGGIEEKLNTPIEEKLKDNNTVLINTITNNKKDIYIVQFDEFWNLYPKKEGKKKCQDKYIKLLKSHSHETIMNGTINYVKQIKINRTEKKYIKQPLTFLNGEHFNDEFDFTTNGGNRNNGQSISGNQENRIDERFDW